MQRKRTILPLLTAAVITAGGIATGPAPAQSLAAGPALTVDVTAGRHLISRNIYGMNFADSSLLNELRLPLDRWGGNATTRYNYLNDTSNRASDWFFENIPNEVADPTQLPDGSSSDLFVEQDRATGTDTVMTVPLIGWVPKAREKSCGFSVTKYGPQHSTDQWAPDCGNGVAAARTNITGNDPQDTSMSAGPEYISGWIDHLTGRYGGRRPWGSALLRPRQ